VAFSKFAWQEVPAGREQQARENQSLEIQEPAEVATIPEPAPVEVASEPEPITPQEVIKNIRGNRKGGRK
jgi:hypothetical protein